MTRFEKTVCGLALAGGLVIPFLLDGYTIRVAAMALYYVILASSWNLLLGYAGQLSFAHAAFAGSAPTPRGCSAITTASIRASASSSAARWPRASAGAWGACACVPAAPTWP